MTANRCVDIDAKQLREVRRGDRPFRVRSPCLHMGSSLTEAHLGELKQIFELFDGDADGLLDVAEVGAILQLVGDTALTEAEVLDMVTEVAPEQRKLPFSEFVNIMCRPMVGKEALAVAVAGGVAAAARRLGGATEQRSAREGSRDGSKGRRAPQPE